MKRINLNEEKISPIKKIEARGSRPKFWFTFLRDDKLSQDKWLFKNTNKILTSKNNSAKTFEDIGEVIFSKICKKLNIDCVDYKLAEIQDAFGLRQGVICKNYNPDSFPEFSGYAILEFYRNFIYDNFNGIISANDNTLANYKKSLNCIMLNYQGKEIFNINVNVNQIFRSLTKMMILDFICCQSDRNWYNISFLIDTNTKELKMAPLFDNGNIFSWNFRESVINHQKIVLSKISTYEKFKELYQSKSLALGINTPVSNRDTENSTKANNLKYKNLPGNIIEEELSDLIIQDVELQKFLNKCKNIPTYLEEAFNEFNEEYEENYEFLKNQACLIAKIKQQYIFNLVNEKIKEMRSDDEYIF